MSFGNIPSTQDKLICAALYTGLFIPAMTLVPLAWIIIANLRKSNLKDFVKYHCYQAALFNMIVFFLPDLFGVLVRFIINFLSLFVIFDNSITLLGTLSAWIIKLYYVLIKVVAIYAIIWTARGKYTYLPPISQAVNTLLR